MKQYDQLAVASKTSSFTRESRANETNNHHFLKGTTSSINIISELRMQMRIDLSIEWVSSRGCQDDHAYSLNARSLTGCRVGSARDSIAR